MSEKISVTLDVQVIGGPRISESLTKEVEAYDKIEVLILKNTNDKEVDVQPGGSGQVKFLMIRLTDPQKYSDKVTYKVNTKGTVATSVPAIELDAPQILIGIGGIKLLDQAPTKLFFSNAWPTDDISVQILVGRDATP